MTQFQPLVPSKAIELIEGAAIPHAQRLIRDHAAAGLVKSYAMLVETIEVSGATSCVRGAAMPVEIWRRIVAEGADEDVWTGGTVRLAPSELVGSAPAVNITGIGFNGTDLQRLIDQHRGALSKRAAPGKIARSPIPTGEDEVTIATANLTRHAPNPAAIAPGAILCTIKQAGEALGFGRTKVNELMNSGQLERRLVGSAPRITVESVTALAACTD